MHILVVSNYYPPHFIGGYELGCHQVVQALRAKGHMVRVLTSTYGVEQPCDDGEVSRRLRRTNTLPPASASLSYGRALAAIEAANQRTFRRLCRQARPDIIYFWNMDHLSISAVFQAERMGIPTSFFISDGWLARWRTDRWSAFLQRFQPRLPHRRLLWAAIRLLLNSRRILRPAGQFDTRFAQFCSHYQKRATLEAGVPVEDAQVIHWGVDTTEFSYRPRSGPTRTLLYVGQLVAHKGVHTALEALRLAHASAPSSDFTLTLAGGSTDADYVEALKRQAADAGMTDSIRFTGSLVRTDLPTLYREHDVLIFPSRWEEPFAITPLEAMSSGLAVIGTMTGGSPELFVEGENALTFLKEDAAACARQLILLHNDRALFHAISAQGRKTIETRFGFGSMVNQIEATLLQAYERGQAQTGKNDTRREQV